MSAVNPTHALVVDDEFNNRDFAEKLLQKAGLTVCSAATANEALTIIRETPNISMALIDYELPDMKGTELIKQLRTLMPDLLLVMATMHDDSQLIDRAFDAGANVFIIKPNGFIELYRSLSKTDSFKLDPTEPIVIDSYGPRKYKRVNKTAQA
jgi:CheY-like chemotaxis protein